MTVSDLCTHVVPKAYTVSAFSPRCGVKAYTVARAALIAVVLVLLGAATSDAHPLGNFSVNHLSTVSISADRVEVRYVLDQAEIPTVQERGLDRPEVLRRKLGEVDRGLSLTVGGRPVPLRAAARPKLTFPPGAGGLTTTRLDLTLNAVVRKPSHVALEDNTFPGRVGWKAIVAAPGEGTAVRTATPSGDPTDGLRTYPAGLLDDPADRREARFSVTPGNGTLIAPGDGGAGAEETSSDGGFAGLFEDAAAGRSVLVLMLLAALGWGALHALSPGHGKAMVAAYLIGTRGTPRDAVVLGATVTVMHTIGVFALGLITLALSQYVLPEQLYPWLTLISGLMVVAVGAGVLRSHLRRRSAQGGGDAHGGRPAHDDHGHAHDDHGHAHQHGHAHHDAHAHAQWHAAERGHGIGTRGLLGMGAAAGLLPCPSALVVLLAAISQHEVALGMLLIVAFSLGLAGTLTALGLVVVHARRFLPPRIAAGRLAALLPALSAAVVVALGLVLAAGAVPDLA